MNGLAFAPVAAVVELRLGVGKPKGDAGGAPGSLMENGRGVPGVVEVLFVLRLFPPGEDRFKLNGFVFAAPFG